ncbi:alpha/beta hydrolase family protein [Gordonia sp. NB41Y]|uniref:alpha/beta hydrolase family protein n=1 Tax=Gordonia sp. NB41Y TaxID=875808 RepID=UPI0006B16A89|nr:alpha/beta hydrolase family protein [Gordonia sp. NB41Y]EMP14442.2 hypothetical protein ISGA_2165 [Gordonia sp. NB41Y]WLP89595.1 alpha/beta hydrolase family protein [Gordonia sp. NB41Y]
MIDWGTGVARAGLFASVLPRAVASARIAGRGRPDAGVPPSAVGPRVVGESALDEFFIAINSVIRDIPPLEVIEGNVARCDAVAAEFTALGIEGIHQRPNAPRIVSQKRKMFGTTRFDQIDYLVDGFLPQSVVVDDPYAGMTASARVLSRSGKGRRWIIWVHGAAQGRNDDLYAFRAGHLHGALDYDVALPVLPAHGARRLRKVAYPGMDPLVNVVLTIRAVVEIRALIRWIARREPAEIVIAGTSLGGPIAALVATLEPDVSGTLAVVPMLDLHGTLAHHMDRAGSRGRELAALMRSDPVTAVSSVIDPLALDPMASPDRRLVVAALNDRVTSLSAARKLHAHWGGQVYWYAGSHVGHAMSRGIQDAVDDFLA